MPAPTSSLEWNCEEAVRLLLEADERLEDLEFRHFDNDSAGALDVVVLKGEKGAERLDGVKGADVIVKAEYATATKTPTELDEISAALGTAVYAAAGDVSDLPFEFLSIEPETSMAREDGKKVRKRTVSFPMIAKLLTA